MNAEKNKAVRAGIRNFSIIAHIDHGKSTLADRFLEITGAVEKRKMREQFLDQMDLERERGITIKMQPVRMSYQLSANSYQLNMIDTPGHIDFSYEVSRSLKAVEGVVLLVDATQGVQAQTFSNAEMAKSLGLAIIPVVNKIDLAGAKIAETKEEMANLLNCPAGEILEVSAKTGQGVERLLEEIIYRIPPPQNSGAKLLKRSLAPLPRPNSVSYSDSPQALIFDFSFSPHKGVIAYCRVFKGEVKKGDELFLFQAKEKFSAHEVGFFRPQLQEEGALKEGEIGYIITNIKKPAIVRVGDTITSLKAPLPALPGYEEPRPVVWASIYPESQPASPSQGGDDFWLLSQALERLHLSDSSLSFEEEGSGPPAGGLGRGFKCGFLGMLHLEIIAERLKREFNLKLITAAPSVAYSVYYRDGRQENIYSPSRFPDEFKILKVLEPMIEMKIITPAENLAGILKILQKHESEIGETGQFGGSRMFLRAKMALREFMRNFFDELKSVSEGYGSLDYKIAEMAEADVVRLDILVAEELVSAFSRVVKKSQAQADAKELVERLKKLLPRALFAVKIQARCSGRIIASQTLPAMKKDVTGYLYGGDRTRKMKLWQKQKAGKKRLKERGKLNIPHEVFLKMLAP